LDYILCCLASRVENRSVFPNWFLHDLARRARLTVALAVMGLVWLMAGDATASCGDYVHVAARQSDGQPLQTQPMVDEGALPGPFQSGSPCRGPNCSQSPRPVPSPPTTPTRSTHEPLALAFTVPIAALRQDGALIDELAVGRGIRRSSPPDPPPRFALR